MTILEKVAVTHGVSLCEVQEEIQKAIGIAMRSTDPLVRARWTELGKEPSPEELVITMARSVHAEKAKKINMASPAEE